MRPRGRADAGPSEACASVCLRGVRVIIMPTPRCCRHPSVIRTPPSPSITTVDAVSCDPRPGAPGLWHRSDGRVEVRAGARLTPATLVQLASACYALRQAGHHPVLRADDAAVREYLWRCGFLAVVHPVARVEPPMSMAIAPGCAGASGLAPPPRRDQARDQRRPPSPVGPDTPGPAAAAAVSDRRRLRCDHGGLGALPKYL